MSGGVGDARVEAEPLLGRTVAGRYRIDEILGHGAMGVVYAARHLDLDRPVALKVLRNLRTNDRVLLKRFRREARTAGRLTHPHCVQVLDFGEDQDGSFLYLVMERVEGVSLDRVLAKERRLTPERACFLMAQVASVLRSAHEMNIVHCDIKPANVLLSLTQDEEGRPRESVKVCDFGLAQLIHDHADPSQSGKDLDAQIVGTPVYMSPEQAVGDPLDARTDIYACGVMLYQMVCGRPPFLAEKSMQVLMEHVGRPPPPPTLFVPDLPPVLEKLLLWCLAKTPEERCPDARTLRARLKDLANELVDLEVPLHTTDSLIEWMPEPATATAPPGPGPAPAPAPAPAPLPDDAILIAPESQTSVHISDLTLEAPVSTGWAVEPADAVDDDPIDALVAQAVTEAVAEATSQSGPRDDRMAGLDLGRHADAVAERATYMFLHYGITYDGYSGPHPFWVRDPQGELLGPLSPRDMMRLSSTTVANGTIRQLLVSADGDTWMPATRFVRLIGHESWLDAELGEDDGPPLKYGQLELTSLVSLLGRVVRDGYTGRLRLERGSESDRERGEIHFVNGLPTFVHVSGDAFQMTHILTKRGHLRNDLLAGYLHRCSRESVPLERILAEDAGLPAEHWRLGAMRDRFNHLMGWQTGRYGFDDQRLPSTLRPFAPSILALARDYATRLMDDRRLSEWIHTHRQDPIQPSSWLPEGVAALRLNEGQWALVATLLKRKTVSQALDSAGDEAGTARALLYLMMEADMLLRPI